MMLRLVLLLFLVPSRVGAQAIAPDPTDTGPLAVTSAEYKFPAALDPEILTTRPVEIWARVYRPVDLSGAPFPLIVVLHGNHATCGFGSNPRVDDRVDYTTTGTCPDGYVVAPSHAGYGYLAERLASWGYIVVSINANRGINAGAGVPGDEGLNIARGRLILRHLQRLSEWNTSGGTPPSLGVDLQGKLHFGSVGLLGHSRGGEGVRAAYNLYREPGSPWPSRIPDPVIFQGIFEIGAVDGQQFPTPRNFNADGTVWNALLPMCDGDVSNLQGVRPFDRMLQIRDENPTQKSTYTVWGANHNFYNTEWQVSDSAGCLFHPALFPFVIGSLAQQQTGLVAVMAFFRANVGPVAESRFNQNFNPLFEPPAAIANITRVDRGYTPSPNSTVTSVFEDFDRPTGTNTWGVPNDISVATITHGPVPNHASPPFGDQRAGAISWTTSGNNVFFQSNWGLPGQGFSLEGLKTLDLRVSRQHNPALNPNPNAPTNFTIQLALANGTLSPAVELSTYTDLRGPVGGDFVGNYHPILQTFRIPLTDFGSTDLTQVRGVRLTFNRTPTGAIYVANIRLATVLGSGVDDAFTESSVQTTSASSDTAAVTANTVGNGGGGAQNVPGSRNVVIHTEGNVIRSIRSVDSADSLQGEPGVEIELFSDDAFPVRNELVILRIGEREFAVSRYPNGDTHTLVFTLTPSEFDEVTSGNRVIVQYGSGEASEQWDFGTLDKARLAQRQ